MVIDEFDMQIMQFISIIGLLWIPLKIQNDPLPQTELTKTSN